MGARKPPAAEYVHPTRLVPWPGNPRVDAGAVDAVMASITRFGFGAPIVARRADREIITGHMRHAAALRLGLAEVPVRWMDLSAAEAHALALADNKLGEVAEWDDAMLRGLLAEMRESDPEAVAVAGWDEEALDAMLADPVGDEMGGAATVEEVNVETVNVPRFWVTVVGPADIHEDVTARIRAAVAGLDGVVVATAQRPAP